MSQLNRRNFLHGAVALVAAPAIVRVASLMPVKQFAIELPRRNTYLTMNMIMREAVRLWKNSNSFLESIDKEYAELYSVQFAEPRPIGTTLKIKLPNNFKLK